MPMAGAPSRRSRCLFPQTTNTEAMGYAVPTVAGEGLGENQAVPAQDGRHLGEDDD